MSLIWDDFSGSPQGVSAPGTDSESGVAGEMWRIIGIDRAFGWGSVRAQVQTTESVYTLSADAGSKGDAFIEWRPKTGLFDLSEYREFIISGSIDHGPMLVTLSLYDGLARAWSEAHVEGEYTHSWELSGFGSVVMSHIEAVRLDFGMERVAQDMFLRDVMVDVPVVDAGALVLGGIVALMASKRIR